MVSHTTRAKEDTKMCYELYDNAGLFNMYNKPFLYEWYDNMVTEFSRVVTNKDEILSNNSFISFLKK